MKVPVKVSGWMSATGAKFVSVFDGEHALLPLREFTVGNRALASSLSAQGVTFTERSELSSLVKTVSEMTEFTPARILNKAGWNDEVFAFLDGDVPVACGRSLLRVLFDPNKACAPEGRLVRWKMHLTKAVAAHSLPSFAIAAMYLPCLLRFMPLCDNPVIEFVGQGDAGSLLAKMAASAVGHIGIGKRDRYWLTFDEVASDFRGTIERHNDHPIVIDDVANTLTTGDAKRLASISRNISYSMQATSARALVMLAGKRSLRSASGGALDDCEQLISINLPPLGADSIFTPLPASYTSVEAYGEDLLLAAAANCGKSHRWFLEKMISARKKDQVDFERHITELQEEFLGFLELEGYSGLNRKTARIFAGIYAAGMLAVEYKAVSHTFDCKAAVLSAVKLHVQSLPDKRSFAERVEALVASEDVVKIERGADEEAQIRAASAAIGTLKRRPTCRVLTIRQENILKAFSDWEALKDSEEVRRLLKCDGRNLQAQGKLAPGMGRERLFTFVLPKEPV